MSEIKPLTLAEKCLLVAMFSDVSQVARDRLLDFATADARSGIIVGNRFQCALDRSGRVVLRLRPYLFEEER